MSALPRFACCQCSHVTHKLACFKCQHRLCAECKAVLPGKRGPKPIGSTVFSRREAELVKRMACGQRLTQISAEIYLSKTTLTEYRRRVMQKLALPQGSSDVAIVLAAWRRGDVELSREVPA